MKRLLFTFMLCMAGLTVTAQTHSLNYWFDGDYASHTTLTSATGTWNAEIDVAQLRVGFHTLQLQVADTTGRLDPPRSFLFYRTQPQDTTPVEVSYWFDGDYAAHSTGSLGQQLINVATMRDGFHTLSLRIGNGIHAQQHGYLFFKKHTADTSMHGYRYWFDDDYANMVEGQATGNVLVDVSALRDGFHTLYLSMTKDSESELRYNLFYKVPVAQAADSVVTYWFDGMDSAMTTKPIGEGLVMIDVADLSDTMHTIYLVVGRGRTAQQQSYEFLKVPVIYTVTLATADSTRGTVSGAGDYPRNSTVSISATAEYGYQFSVWSDGDTNALRSIMLTQDTSLTAYFVPDTFQFDITVSDTSMGTVVVTGTSEYLGTDTATAVPNYGYHFSGWSDGDTTNPRLVTLTQDTTLTATFAPNIYTVTLASNTPEWGSVVGGGEYEYLAIVPLEAVAIYGYQFKQWNDGNTDNPRQLVVRGDTTLTATFELLRYNLTVVSNDLSRGFTQGGGTFNMMDTATALAITLAGNSFIGWADGSMDNPRQLQLSSDTTLTAIFQALDSVPETIIVHDTTMVTVTDTLTMTEYVQIHDTAYIDVHDTTYVPVHDTTIVTVIDTVTMTEYVPVHDTTYITDTLMLTQYDTVTNTVYDTVTNTVFDTVNNYIYDTVTLYDTTVVMLTDTVVNTLYDTVINTVYDTIDNYVYDTTVVIDTLLVDNYIYDTVTLYDTTVVTLTDTVVNTLYDTVINTVYDTIDNYVYDTTVVVDTVTLTEHVPVHDTTYITLSDTVTLTQYDTITNTVYDTITNTVYDTVTNTVFDTIDNYIYDTLTVTDTLWLTLYDTILVHDTIIIYDTIEVGIGDVETLNARIYTCSGQIVVEGADGNDVRLYDVVGRVLATKQDYGMPIRFDAPASGTYLIKIGTAPARRIVVVK